MVARYVFECLVGLLCLKDAFASMDQVEKREEAFVGTVANFQHYYMKKKRYTHTGSY